MDNLEESQRDLVSFCGTRGIPANYGGFETAVDEISLHFIRQGFQCEVFCRASNGDGRMKVHRGRFLTYVKGSTLSKLDTFVSSIQTGWNILKNRKRYKHVFWFNNANFPGILMTRLAGIPTTVNTDGLEWRRTKWSWPFKLYYFVVSAMITRLCPTLISDSFGIRDFYKKTFGVTTNMIPYGAPSVPDVSPVKALEVLRDYGLDAGKYFLQITRFEPDNLPLEAIRGFRRSGLARMGYKFLLVGYKEDSPYVRQIRAYDGHDGISVVKAEYDPEVLTVLRENCFSYVHGNSVGGTNPALLEAMASCPRIMAIDCEFSHEVLGDLGSYFSVITLPQVFHAMRQMPSQRKELYRSVNSRYQWRAVARSYVGLCEGDEVAYTPETVPVESPEAVAFNTDPIVEAQAV